MSCSVRQLKALCHVQTANSSVTYQHLAADNPDVRFLQRSFLFPGQGSSMMYMIHDVSSDCAPVLRIDMTSAQSLLSAPEPCLEAHNLST